MQSPAHRRPPPMARAAQPSAPPPPPVSRPGGGNTCEGAPSAPRPDRRRHRSGQSHRRHPAGRNRKDIYPAASAGRNRPLSRARALSRHSSPRPAAHRAHRCPSCAAWLSDHRQSQNTSPVLLVPRASLPFDIERASLRARRCDAYPDQTGLPMLPDEKARAEGRAPLPLLVFLALMTSVSSLTIDAILPALDSISRDLGFREPTDQQLIVLAVFAGLGLGQPIFGPLSDAIGRRKAAMLGWAVYVLGTAIAVLAPNLGWIVAGRVVQGFGAAGPRVVATAIARDIYEGRAMARIISLVMTVFMLVPMFAPLLGQGLQAMAGWRAIFGLYLGMAILSGAWHLFVPETLPVEHRRPLHLGPLLRAFVEVLRTPPTMLYTAGTGMIFASFAAFLAASQQVYEHIYGLGHLFPLVFAAMGLVFAAAQYLNGILVMRVGMRAICRTAAIAVTLGGAVAFLIGHSSDLPLGARKSVV